MRTPIVLVLLALTLHLHAATTLSPEQLIAEPRPGTPRIVTNVALASDGSHGLAVWASEGGLTATLIGPDGQVPDRARAPQVPVAIEPSFKDLSVVWTGSVYLITWTSGVDVTPSVRAATLSSDGTLLTPPVRVASNASARAGALTAGPNGALGVYLTGDTSQFRAVLFDRAGNVVATGLPLPALNAGDPTDLVRVASDGNEYAYVWRTADDFVIAAAPTQRFDTFLLLRLDTNGHAIGAPIKIARLESTNAFDVAFGSGEYALITSEQQLISPGNLRYVLSRFFIDARAGSVTSLTKLERAGFSSVVWNGSAFVTYGATPDYSALQTLTFINPESHTPDPVTMPVATSLAAPFIEMVSGRLIAVWNAGAVKGLILDTTGTSITNGPFLVSVSWSRQMMPAIAASTSESLAIWVEDGNTLGGALMGRRFTRSGDAIGPSFVLAEASIDQPPVVTFTGAKYQAFWRERQRSGGGRIITRTIALDGALGPRVDLGPGSAVTAASNDKMTLAAFLAPNISAYRFTPNGDPVSTQPIALDSSELPRAATNGTDFLVGWDDGRDVFAIRVFANGSVDAAAIPIATGGGHALAAIESDGRDYMLFIWSVANTGLHTLQAKRLLREGQLDGTTAAGAGTIVANMRPGGFPTVFQVHASRDRSGFSLSWFDNVPNDSQLHLTRTDLDARPMETLPVFSSFYEPPFAVAALTNGETGPQQLVYARSLNGTSQVFLRSVQESVTRRRSARP